MHLLAIALGAWFAAQAAPEAAAFPGLPALAGDTARQAARLFRAHCAPCHGPRGEGGRGPTLSRPKLPQAPDDKALFDLVKGGGSVYYKAEAEYKPGTLFFGGGERGIPGDEAYGALRALEPETGKCVWEFRLQTPPWAGVLSTAGGLVFGGTNEGAFFALDATTGKPLWHFQTGEKIAANPVSYQSEGKQHVAIAAGHAIFSFALDYVADPSGRK